MEDEISYKKLYEAEKKKVESLVGIRQLYERNGNAKLYYALQRKANEMADMLNSINLTDVKLDDPKDKTFERLRFIINDSSSIAIAVKSIGDTAGVTGDEKKDTERKPFIETVAQQRN
jgi:hypothetical protein